MFFELVAGTPWTAQAGQGRLLGAASGGSVDVRERLAAAPPEALQAPQAGQGAAEVGVASVRLGDATAAALGAGRKWMRLVGFVLVERWPQRGEPPSSSGGPVALGDAGATDDGRGRVDDGGRFRDGGLGRTRSRTGLLPSVGGGSTAARRFARRRYRSRRQSLRGRCPPADRKLGVLRLQQLSLHEPPAYLSANLLGEAIGDPRCRSLGWLGGRPSVQSALADEHWRS